MVIAPHPLLSIAGLMGQRDHRAALISPVVELLEKSLSIEKFEWKIRKDRAALKNFD
jgi:hypothetical protein